MKRIGEIILVVVVFKIGSEVVEKVRGLRYHAIIHPKDYTFPAMLSANLVGCKNNVSLHEIMGRVCGSGLDYKLGNLNTFKAYKDNIDDKGKD